MCRDNLIKCFSDIFQTIFENIFNLFKTRSCIHSQISNFRYSRRLPSWKGSFRRRLPNGLDVHKRVVSNQLERTGQNNLELQFVPINGSTYYGINRLIVPKLYQLSSPKFLFHTQCTLTSFAYYFQSVIVIRKQIESLLFGNGTN